MWRLLVVLVASAIAAEPCSTDSSAWFLSPVCGNVTGARAYWGGASGVASVEAEAAVAYQALHQRLLSFQCWTVADRIANCDACLVAYSRLLCARHLPCLVTGSAGGQEGCASLPSCSASALPCPALCEDAVRLCPFDVLGSMACPSSSLSLIQAPAGTLQAGELRGRAATDAEVEARPAPATWGANGCFLGWGGG